MTKKNNTPSFYSKVKQAILYGQSAQLSELTKAAAKASQQQGRSTQ